MDRLAEMAIDEATSVHLAENVPAARLALDARRWYVSKIAPRRYGEKLEVKSQHELSGPNGGPIQHQVLLDVLLSPANLERLDAAEIESIRSAALKLAGPDNVVDADYEEVPT